MRRHVFRYLAPGRPAIGAEIELAREDSHHLARVVRRRAGDRIELIGESGGLWAATIVDPGPPARVRVVAGPRAGPPPAPVRLHVGLTDAARLAALVETAAELGVPEIAVMTCERGRPVGDWAGRAARLERVAIAAARQAGHAAIPRVRGLVPFERALTEAGRRAAYLLDPEALTPLDHALSDRPATATEVALMVGPAAGFSEHEVAAARAGGVRPVRVGPATLRVETAAIVATVLALSAVGHLAREE